MEEKTQTIQIYLDRESAYASPVAIRHNCSACRKTRRVASYSSPSPVSGRRVRVLRPVCLLTFSPSFRRAHSSLKLILFGIRQIPILQILVVC